MLRSFIQTGLVGYFANTPPQRARPAIRSLTSRTKSLAKSTTSVNFTDAHHHPTVASSPPIPKYLQDTYWWAYIHPNAIFVFERQWLVNLILWGNFHPLRDAAIQSLVTKNDKVTGHTLQVACVYGDLTTKLLERMRSDATLDVVDVAPTQIDNLHHKLEAAATPRTVHVTQCNATNLVQADQSMDQVLLFFLLHEMPNDVRRQTLAEACRVLTEGGRLVLVDYHMPTAFPHNYIMPVVWDVLEPFATELATKDIMEWVPEDVMEVVERETFYQGLYQKVVLQKKK